MKDKTILKLTKLMSAGAKSIALGDKAIESIKQTQSKTVDAFAAIVKTTVKESKEQIAKHEAIIKQAEGMTL